MLTDRLLRIVCWWFHHNYVAVSETELWCTCCHKRAPRAFHNCARTCEPVEFTPMEPELALIELRADMARARRIGA